MRDGLGPHSFNNGTVSWKRKCDIAEGKIENALDHCEKGWGLRGPVKEWLSRDIESMGNCGEEDFHPTLILEKFSTVHCTSPTSGRKLPGHFWGLWGLQFFLRLLLVGLGVLYGDFSIL